MERTKAVRVANAEVKAGVFLTFCLALFFLMMVVYGRFSRTWADRLDLTVAFAGVPALKPGAPVRYNGMEVGRVKGVGVVRLTERELERFPLLSEADLERLPFGESEISTLREELAGLSPAAVDRRLKNRLRGRSMVELELDVLLERDAKRYRLDDVVSVSATMMGEAWVTISSGVGPAIPSGYDKVLLGVSADVTGDLVESVDRVGEIIGTAGATLGGGKKRAGLREKIARFEGFTADFETACTAWRTRLDSGWNELDDNLDENGKWLHSQCAKVRGWGPRLEKALNKLRKTCAEWRETLRKKTADAPAKIGKFRKTAVKKLATWATATAAWKTEWPPRFSAWRKLSERFGGYADRAEALLEKVRRSVGENLASLRRDLRNWARTAEDKDETMWYIANRPWTIVNRPPREKAAALDLLRRLDLAARHYRELRGELAAVVEKAVPGNEADRRKLRRLRKIVSALNVLEAEVNEQLVKMKKVVWKGVE